MRTSEREIVGDWDRERLGRVLANLVENAIKYSPDGGRVEVAVRLLGANQRCAGAMANGHKPWVVVRVKDHGIGIPEEQQDFLFERFYRAGPAVYQDSSGLGLGLYTANRIVTAHGGRMHVRSHAQKGSRFFLFLPLDAEEQTA